MLVVNHLMMLKTGVPSFADLSLIITGKSPVIVRATLAVLLFSAMSCGCSSKADSVKTQATLNYATTRIGFNQLLNSLPAMKADEQKQQLRAFYQSTTDEGLKQRSAYVLGRALQRSATPAELVEAIDSFSEASELQALRPRAFWHQIECAQAAGDEATVRKTLELISKEHDGPNNGISEDIQVTASYMLGQSFMRTGDFEQAKARFLEIQKSAPQSQYALGAGYYLVQIEARESTQKTSNEQSTAKTGSSAEMKTPLAPPWALTVLRHYLDACPDGRFALEIIAQLNNMDGFKPTIDDHNRFARVYYSSGSYAQALSEWRKAENTSEWLKQATCMLRTARGNEGKLALQAGITNHPQDASVQAAATLLCNYLSRDGAIQVWKGVLQRSPQLADSALYNLATRADSSQESKLYYGKLFREFPNSTHAPDAGWWCAWYNIEAGNWHDALEQLQIVCSHYPNAKETPRCQFWIGKINERLGNVSLAKSAYENAAKLHGRSYYGHRAKARLSAINGGKDPEWGINAGRTVKWSHDTASDWQFPEPPHQLAQQAGPTIQLLTELKQWDECVELLKEKSGLLRAFYLAKSGLPLSAINAAYSTLGSTPCKTHAWQLAYPLLYARLISAESASKELDPFLVQALIREESRYNAQAVSGSNALGLMQLMPATAYGVAKRLGITISSKDDIHNPENNLRMGIDYLSYVLKRFNGSALHAVASYNGGPNAVARWAKKWPGDKDFFVERIPYKETREYVRKVFGSYWNYEAIYQTCVESATVIQSAPTI